MKSQFYTTRLFFALVLLIFSIPSNAQYPDAPYPMSEDDFNHAMAHVAKESFDDDKMRVAKQIIRGNYLYASQIREIVKQFTFAKNQEHMAMHAYPKCYDQKKYYVVYTAFTFPSSKDKVSDWVGKQPINDYTLIDDDNHNHSPHDHGGLDHHHDLHGHHHVGPIPMADNDFSEAMSHIRRESFDDGKMEISKQVIKGNFLYANQIKQIVKQFTFSKNQEHMAMHAYPKCYDQKNYYVVNDVFTFPSSKDKLSHWLEGQPINDYSMVEDDHHHHDGHTHNHHHGDGDYNHHHHGDYNDYHPTNNGGGVNINPNVNGGGVNIYPNGDNGNGNNNNTNNNNDPNQVALSNADFNNVKNQLRTIASDRDKVERAKQITDQTYLTAQQVKEIMEMLIFEDARLDYAKYAYIKTVDQRNYYLPKEALSQVQNKQNLDDYIRSIAGGNNNNNNNNNNGPRGAEAMSNQDFNTAKARLAPIPSDSDKLIDAKELLDNNYVSTQQVKELIMLFIFEDVRLDFAKYAYGKTIDPENYALVKEALSNNSSKLDLQQYIDGY